MHHDPHPPTTPNRPYFLFPKAAPVKKRNENEKHHTPAILCQKPNNQREKKHTQHTNIKKTHPLPSPPTVAAATLIEQRSPTRLDKIS
jgi:hypothetical protein